MGSMVTIDGRLIDDPVVEYPPNGKPVVNMRIAVEREQADAETGETITDFYAISTSSEFLVRAAKEGRLSSGDWVVVYGSGEFRRQDIGDQVVEQFQINAREIVSQSAPTQFSGDVYSGGTSKDSSRRLVRSCPPSSIKVDAEFVDPFAGLEDTDE